MCTREQDLLITAGTDFHSRLLHEAGKIDYLDYDPREVLGETIERVFGERN
jgi:hypothetical protein